MSQLRLGKHQNKHLQASWDKWGEKVFEFCVLENMSVASKRERLLKEEEWIGKYYSTGKCFNNTPYAISREGHKSKTPEETRKLISQRSKEMWAKRTKKERQGMAKMLRLSRTRETYEKVSKALTGIKRSKETIEKTASKNRGRERPHSEEFKTRMKQLRSQQSGTKIVCRKNAEELRFASGSEAARYFGVNVQTVFNWIKSAKSNRNGWLLMKYLVLPRLT